MIGVMYPTAQERAVIEAAEEMMVDTMARYDSSHDVYHGEHEPIEASGGIDQVLSVERVRKTALTIALNVPTQPDLLVVELGALV